MSFTGVIEYHKMELFGGAITVELPASFIDVSDVRQVPDHQEVYLDRDGFASICFDILEYVEPSDTPLNALQLHLEDIDKDLTTEAVSRTVTDLQLPKLSYYSTAVSAQVDVNRENQLDLARSGVANNSQATNILVLLLRLEKYRTDILISVNFQDTDGDHVNAKAYLDKIVETFEIKDYGLFA